MICILVELVILRLSLIEFKYLSEIWERKRTGKYQGMNMIIREILRKVCIRHSNPPMTSRPQHFD